jgi:hypothetical protein
MQEKVSKEELKAEIDRGEFARAALMAESLGLDEKEVQQLRLNALWQMSAVYRNAPGTKRLAEQYGLSKNEVRQILEKHADEEKKAGNERPLRPRYDLSSGRYLSFEEWTDHFTKKWERLSRQ